jgi:predicted GNAT family acetyltransferase
MSQEIAVQNNSESGSYEAILDGRVVGLIVYERRDSRMIFRHTIVDPGYRGRGIATELVRAALDDLIVQGLTLTNYCGFIDSFIAVNPAYAKVVDQYQPGRVTPFEVRHETERLGQQIG